MEIHIYAKGMLFQLFIGKMICVKRPVSRKISLLMNNSQYIHRF
ncbi:MAG TPA: hypothetical protein P5120_15100 [Spirochaetota bacterium]|nr:hypothetical protein [Spirochaetota bacterium]HPF07078.1 hypothetical protein [Spirochaetota bacterium]HPJ44232.1 hypothetical protein [Spirochaetota bacterium]HPR38450.1 hypothetical protein [Spirochaetota bacterium]HRX48846.1 hypothetical protein [Spirochaetota bacterium]